MKGKDSIKGQGQISSQQSQSLSNLKPVVPQLALEPYHKVHVQSNPLGDTSDSFQHANVTEFHY